MALKTNMELLLHTLAEATEVNRRFSRHQLRGGADLTQREIELIRRGLEQNAEAFAAELEKAAKATQNAEFLKRLAVNAAAYTHSYVDVIDGAGLPAATVTKLKEMIKAHIDNEIRKQVEGVNRNKDLDGMRINFLKDAWKEERRWARSLEEAAKKHGIAMERVSSAAHEISAKRGLISKLVSVLKYLGAGALGAALQAIAANSQQLLAMGATVGAVGAYAYATKTLGRRTATRQAYRARAFSSLASLVETMLSPIVTASRRLARAKNWVTTRYNEIATKWSDWFKTMGLAGLTKDLKRIEEYAAQGIQEAEIASKAAEAWLQNLPVNVVQYGWAETKAEKAKIMTAIGVAVSKMRLASEARTALKLRVEGRKLLFATENKLMELELRQTLVPKIPEDRGTDIDVEMDEWVDGALKPALESVKTVKQRLNQMEAIVTEFEDILLA